MPQVVSACFRVLTFRATADELDGLDRRHLAFGLGITWLVGIVRYWDMPNAWLPQRLGVVALAYVAVIPFYPLLAGYLWTVRSHRRRGRISPLGPTT